MSKQPDNARKQAPAAGDHSNGMTNTRPVLIEVPCGSLPETIGPADLPALNYTLGFLFDGLRKAQSLFAQGQCGGRPGAILAVQRVWRFLTLFEPACRNTLWVPLLSLESALSALDENNVRPLLKPRPRTGRAPASQTYQALIGCVAGTVRRLRDTGLTSAEAHKSIAATLKRLGIKPARRSRPVTDGANEITARTVREWNEKVDADVGRRGTSAFVCDSMLMDPQENQRIATMAPPDARRYILESLAEFVRQTHPAKPPS